MEMIVGVLVEILIEVVIMGIITMVSVFI